MSSLFQILANETLEERRSDLLRPPTGAPKPTVHAPQGAHAVFHRRWPKIAYGAHPVLSLAAMTEARIRSCSGLQLNEGRIVLNHSAPWRPTRPIERGESCQVLLHADTADNW